MEIRDKNVAAPRGLLHERMSMAHFDLIRTAPSAALAPFVENYWVILWDLTGKPAYAQQNLPHPSVNMVIVPNGQTGVFGVQTGVWDYTLAESGRIFGVKFRSGGFSPFCNESVSNLRDTHAPVSQFLNTEDAALTQRFAALNDPHSMAEVMEALLLEKQAVLSDEAVLAGDLVARIAATPDLVRVDELADVAGTSVRSLQRLFDTHIGVGPKWVIERYRMLEAVDALNAGGADSLTALAHQLGYFDQAHFTRAFAKLTGHPPSYYRLSSAAR